MSLGWCGGHRINIIRAAFKGALRSDTTFLREEAVDEYEGPRMSDELN